MDMPDYDELQAALGTAGEEPAAAEAHGTACGLLATGADDMPEAWIRNTLADAGEQGAGSGAEARPLLQRLYEQTVESLQGADMSFQMLLPADEAPLEARAEGLAAWCNGFLYGLAVRGLRPMEELPDELREILSDFSEIGRAGVAEEEAQEAGESAYAELVEYVRVAVQIVFDECRAPAPPPPPAEDRLH
ncbi:MAG TPA: UPF0149 family protein [Gammaproteobacteria bacterium]|nr:UPF0149 family protein [Gammaproteobacteria bacterium]